MFGKMSNFRSDPTGHIGALMMFGFALWAAWRWTNSSVLFYLLLALRDVIAAGFLLVRQPGSKCRYWDFNTGISYVSSALPLFYFPQTVSPGIFLYAFATLLPIVGFTIATIALIDLGMAFGVSPARRNKANAGLYRYVNHPMYMGYAIAEGAMAVLCPANIAIYSTSLVLYYWRAQSEGQLLGEPT